MRQLTALVLTLLIAGCGREPGNQVYKAYVAEHLRGLQYVDASGAVTRRPDFSVDYSRLPDFAAIQDTRERKQAFFDYLRPAVEFRNAVNEERRLLLGAIELKLQYQLPLSAADERFLANMVQRYRLEETLSPEETVKALDRRLDVIPVSMVLAQAAIESGWGTSRFARQVNNIFGQWCYDAGCGVVPDRRKAGAKHEVRAFDSVDAAIDSYFRNLNTHPMYVPLRDIRQEARGNGGELTGVELAAGLTRYSERGQEYIEEVREMIRFNGLEPMNRG